MYYMLTETFTVLLVTILIFCAVNAFNSGDVRQTKKYVWKTGLVMGFLALTKLIFGYVILTMLIGSAILWLLKRSAHNYRKGLLIAAIALGDYTTVLSIHVLVDRSVLLLGYTGWQ
jgi:hypothetical protein